MTKNDKIKISENQEITLSQWFEASIFHEDNLRYEQKYVPEYLAMIKTLDAICWSMDIQKFNIAKTILDAIKVKYFPKWLLQKLPAKIRNININILYPQVSKDPAKVSVEAFKKSQKYLKVTSRVSIYGIDSL